MFSFLKRHRPQEQLYEPELTVRERSFGKDIRDVLKIAKLCNPSDGEDDINRLISIHQKYRKTGLEYN
jgi:hypothetical protein